MKALIDTNIIIDALQSRDGFAKDAEFLILQAFEYSGYITSTSVTDIYYIQHKYYHNIEKAKNSLERILNLYSIIDVTATDCHNALRSGVSDYEDAVMVESAKRNGIDCIVTRNAKDFKDSGIKVYTPTEFLKQIRKSNAHPPHP